MMSDQTTVVNPGISAKKAIGELVRVAISAAVAVYVAPSVRQIGIEIDQPVIIEHATLIITAGVAALLKGVANYLKHAKRKGGQ